MLAPLEPAVAAGTSVEDLDLLLVVAPLLHVLHGEKRARLQRAFINAAISHGKHLMHIDDEGRLPANPRQAALALHRATLDLCARVGVAAPDLVTSYNHEVEQAAFGNGGVQEATERCMALLSLFHARALVRDAV